MERGLRVAGEAREEDLQGSTRIPRNHMIGLPQEMNEKHSSRKTVGYKVMVVWKIQRTTI